MRQARRDAAHGDQAIGAPHLVDGGDARLRLALDALLRRGQIGGGLVQLGGELRELVARLQLERVAEVSLADAHCLLHQLFHRPCHPAQAE